MNKLDFIDAKLRAKAEQLTLAQPVAPRAPATIALTVDDVLSVLHEAQNVVSDFQAAPGNTFLAKLGSRKLLTTLAGEAVSVAMAVSGALPTHEAAILGTALGGIYLLAQAIVDAAAARGVPNGSISGTVLTQLSPPPPPAEYAPRAA
jgi:hypothetical protein